MVVVVLAVTTSEVVTGAGWEVVGGLADEGGKGGVDDGGAGAHALTNNARTMVIRRAVMVDRLQVVRVQRGRSQESECGFETSK